MVSVSQRPEALIQCSMMPREGAQAAYLSTRAADRAIIPLGTAEVHQLFPQSLIRLLRLAVVDARQLFAEEALGAAMVPDGATACLVYGSVEIACRLR